MRKLFKKPVVLIITFILIPFVIIGFLHLFNFLSIQFGINLNPTGIDNAVWFAFFGSFLGGLITLVAVWLTLQSNKEALEQSQRQTIFQAEMQEIQNEQKILSNALSNFIPYTLVDIFLRHQELLNGHYNSDEALSLINDCNTYQMKIESDNIRIRIETNITETKKRIHKKLTISQEAFALKYLEFYAETVRVSNLIKYFIRDALNTVAENGLTHNIGICDMKIARKNNTLFIEIEQYRSSYTVNIAELIQHIKNYIHNREALAKIKLRGEDISFLNTEKE